MKMRWLWILLLGTISVQGQRFVKSLDSLPALIAANPVDVHNVCFIRGYATPGDGGDGTFTYFPASFASTNAGTIFTPSNGSGRWIRQFSGPLNPKWFGAKGDGTTDDAPSINAAIILGESTGIGVDFPGGTFGVATPCIPGTGPNAIQITGSGIIPTEIKALAIMPAVFAASSINQNLRYKFRNFRINGNSKANYGIYSTNMAHCDFENLYIIGTEIAALSPGHGWDNNIINCEFSSNDGDGILFLNGSINAVNIINNKIFLNQGVGINLEEGSGVRIEGCTIEANKKCGIFAKYSTGLTINANYIEGNGQTGIAFTDPVRTNKSEIILNGTSALVYSYANPCKAVKIEGNYVNPFYTSNFVTVVAAQDVRIMNNRSGQAVPLISTPMQFAYGFATRNITYGENNGFSQDILLTDEGDLKHSNLSTFRKTDATNGVNYASDDLFQFTGSGLAPGLLKNGATNFNGFRTIELTNSTANSSQYFVQGFQAADYPELTNRPVYWGMWVKQSAAAMNVDLYFSTIGGGVDFYTTDTSWRWIEHQGLFPNTGTLQVGVRRIGGNTNDLIQIAKPVLALVGVPPDNFYRTRVNPPWSTNSVPTIGYWRKGDTVLNSDPDASEFAGWKAVTTGDPPTWKTFGPITP